MCAQVLQRFAEYQRSAAVSVFIYLTCVICTVAAYWCVSMTQVLNTDLLYQL